jgi:uncharacterized membrane protein (UPF0127 family)
MAGTITHSLEHVPVATRFRERAWGLIGRTRNEELFLLIPNCASIHTFAMRKAIDVVFLDEENRVVAIHPSIVPWRVCIGPRSARATLELPGGHAAQLGMSIHDIVIFGAPPSA